MTDGRPNTKVYPEDARRALGLAATRAREALGHQWRPSFAKLAKLSVRSIVKLESGEPVGPTVYEAVARVIPGWTEDTPRIILEGGPIPEPVSTEPVLRHILTEREREVLAFCLELLRETVPRPEAMRQLLDIARILKQDKDLRDEALERELALIAERAARVSPADGK